jgi:hypothetical protein
LLTWPAHSPLGLPPPELALAAVPLSPVTSTTGIHGCSKVLPVVLVVVAAPTAIAMVTAMDLDNVGPMPERKPNSPVRNQPHPAKMFLIPLK